MLYLFSNLACTALEILFPRILFFFRKKIIGPTVKGGLAIPLNYRSYNKIISKHQANSDVCRFRLSAHDPSCADRSINLREPGAPLHQNLGAMPEESSLQTQLAYLASIHQCINLPSPVRFGTKVDKVPRTIV